MCVDVWVADYGVVGFGHVGVGAAFDGFCGAVW